MDWRGGGGTDEQRYHSLPSLSAPAALLQGPFAESSEDVSNDCPDRDDSGGGGRRVYA